MTVSSSTVVGGPYTGNGSTTAFPFPIEGVGADEITVLADELEVLSSLYSVTLSETGGTVTFDTAPASGVIIVILSNPAFDQQLALQNNGPFLPEDIEDAFDKAAARDNLLKAMVDAAIPSDALVPGVGQSQFLARDEDGNPVWSDGTGDASEIAVGAALAAAREARTSEAHALSSRNTAITKAGEAEDFRNETEDFRNEAAAFAAASEAGTVNNYDDTTEGIANTVDGEQFTVVGDGGDSVIRYRNDSENATELYRDATKPALDAVLAEPPHVGGEPGDVLTKTGVSDGAFGYAGRDALSDQPVALTDLTDSGEYQFFQAYGPTQRFASSVDGTEIEITSTYAAAPAPVAVGIPSAIEVGKVYIVKARMVTAGAGGVSIGGVFFGYSVNAPVGGDAFEDYASGSALITLRNNGVPVVYDYQSSLAFGGASGFSGAAIPAFTTEEVAIIVEPVTTTSAKVSFYLDGVFVMKRTVTGLPSGCYVTGGIRTTGNGTVARISVLSVNAASLDVTRRIHIHPDVGAVGGTGTEANPYQTLEECVLSLELDTWRRSAELIFKPGLIRGQFTSDALRWHDLRIRGSAGGRTMIYASTQLSGAIWTEILSSGVWYATQPAFISTANSPYGGLVDVTTGVSETFGLGGHYTVEGRRLHSRIAANTAYNHATFVEGSTSNHNTGTYAGKILLKPWGGVDPNTRTYELSNRLSALSIISSDDSDAFNGAIVRISNIELMYGFIACLDLADVQYELEDVFCGGAQIGYGFELNHCTGVARGCIAEGVGADGFHASGIGTTSERELYNVFQDCWTKGAASLPQGLGDGFSFHDAEQHRIALHNCGALSCGKDGASMPGNCEMTNFTADDCAAGGVTLYADAGLAEASLTIRGGLMTRNLLGLNCNPAAVTGVTRTINADRVHFENNTQASLYAFQNASPASSAIINARNCTYSGATPSQGHKVESTGGTVNITNGTSFTA